VGLILDSSLLIADERGKFDMLAFLRQSPNIQPTIAAITASELLHGVERAQDPVRRIRRERHVEQMLSMLAIQPFGIAQARVRARIWAALQVRGLMIGPHDLLIAATGLALDDEVATLNVQEFKRVIGLKVVDATPFMRA
jgi:tRNA(fMet)-specific endonuclease VapC